MRDLLIATLLAAIALLKGLDLMADMSMNLPVEHLVQEWVLLGLSLLGFAFLVYDMRRRTVALRKLRRLLNRNEEQVSSLSAELREARRQHGEAIRNQFEAWRLTESEQQVAMLLLKGLSLREIAMLRETREKTVRQQASNVYHKSNLEGRHALAGWFLEDFLFSPSGVTPAGD